MIAKNVNCPFCCNDRHACYLVLVDWLKASVKFDFFPSNTKLHPNVNGKQFLAPVVSLQTSFPPAVFFVNCEFPLEISHAGLKLKLTC